MLATAAVLKRSAVKDPSFVVIDEVVGQWIALLPAGHEFLYGAVIILAILFMPSGFWGRLRKGHLVSVKAGSIE